MNPAGQPRSAKSLANKRRQLKLKILLLQDRLSTLEEDQQLPSLPEFRVFAKNIERFYGEFDRMLREIEECHSFADERDAHDLECAAIEGLLQGVNNKIVALSLALLSQPVQATEQQQAQPLIVSQQVVIPTPLFTSEALGDGDVPERTDPAAADAKVCASIQLLSSPSNVTTERDDPLCTRCNGCHLSTDCFTPSEVPLDQSHETNSNLKANQSMPERSLQPEKPIEHQEMKLSKEPEVVGHVISTSVRGDVDLSGDSDGTPTQRSDERIHGDFDVGWCQPVELGSLLPADAEREVTESDDPQAVPRSETARLFEEDPDTTSNQTVKGEGAHSLQPVESDEVNVEDRSLPSSAQSVCTAPTVQEDPATKPSHEKSTYSSGFKLFNRRSSAVVARPETERSANRRKDVEKWLKSEISSSTAKKPRLIWDPGLSPGTKFRSTDETYHQTNATIPEPLPNSSASSDWIHSCGFNVRSRAFNAGENVRPMPKFSPRNKQF